MCGGCYMRGQTSLRVGTTCLKGKSKSLKMGCSEPSSGTVEWGHWAGSHLKSPGYRCCTNWRRSCSRRYWRRESFLKVGKIGVEKHPYFCAFYFWTQRFKSCKTFTLSFAKSSFISTLRPIPANISSSSVLTNFFGTSEPKTRVNSFLDVLLNLKKLHVSSRFSIYSAR